MSKTATKSPDGAKTAIAANQSEMFPDLPTIKMPKRVKSRWEELNQLCDIVDEHGPIIPMFVAADLLNLSRQRIHQLVEAGTLVPVEFAGKRWLAEKQLRAFVQLDRTSDRSHMAGWKSNPHFEPEVTS